MNVETSKDGSAPPLGSTPSHGITYPPPIVHHMTNPYFPTSFSSPYNMGCVWKSPFSLPYSCSDIKTSLENNENHINSSEQIENDSCEDNHTDAEVSAVKDFSDAGMEHEICILQTDSLYNDVCVGESGNGMESGDSLKNTVQNLLSVNNSKIVDSCGPENSSVLSEPDIRALESQEYVSDIHSQELDNDSKTENVITLIVQEDGNLVEQVYFPEYEDYSTVPSTKETVSDAENAISSDKCVYVEEAQWTPTTETSDGFTLDLLLEGEQIAENDLQLAGQAIQEALDSLDLPEVGAEVEVESVHSIPQNGVHFDNVEEALNAVENIVRPSSPQNVSASSPATSLNIQIGSGVHGEVERAARALFSKRTRTLYHWMFPDIPKNKLKSCVASAWDTLPESEKLFYMSQVMGRFGSPAGNLMVNPQLGGLSSEQLETERAVAGLLEDPPQPTHKVTGKRKRLCGSNRSKRCREELDDTDVEFDDSPEITAKELFDQLGF